MKKLFSLCFVFISVLLLSSCKNTPTIDDEVPFGDLVLTNVQLVSEVPSVNRALSYTEESNGVISSLSATSYDTVVSSEEWLAVYINQPVVTTDRMVILDIVISVGETQVQWQPVDTLNGRSMEIRKEQNENILYIPIETAEVPGNYEYQIEQIRYIGSDDLIYRVSKNDETIDSIAIIVRYPLIEYVWPDDGLGEKDIYETEMAYLHAGTFNKEERTFFVNPSINSVPNRKIYNIKINDELVFSDVNGYLLYSLTDENIPNPTIFQLPSEFVIETTDWIKVTFDYELTLNELQTYTYYASTRGTTNFTVHNSKDLELIPKGWWGEIYLMTSALHIESGFIPFNGFKLSFTNFSGSSYVTITFEDSYLYLFDGTECLGRSCELATMNTVIFTGVKIEGQVKITSSLSGIDLYLRSSVTPEFLPGTYIEFK